MASMLKRRIAQLFNQKLIIDNISVGLKSSSVISNILKSPYKEIPATNDTICDLVWQNLDQWPDKTVSVCAVKGRGYTYAQTHRMSMSFAASLRNKLKLQTDDKIAVILPNVPEYPFILLGILQAGCVVSPMNPAYTAHELKRQLELIDCKAIVACNPCYANITQALTEMQRNIPIILSDNENVPQGAIKLAEFAEDFNTDTDCLKRITRSPNDVAVIPFSSGTTGFPKGVVLTHRNIVSSVQAVADPTIKAADTTTSSYQAAALAVLPFFHIFGFGPLMINLMSQGVKLVTMPYFKPELFLQAINNYQTDVLFIVPAMGQFMGKHSLVTPEHIKPIRNIICGAAPMSEKDVEAIIAKNNNIAFRQGYGLTETCGVVSVGKRMDKNYSSVGHILPSSELKIEDLETKKALGIGKEGEILFRGPVVMQEYYKNEAATKDVFSDGWYRTGDIGKYDDKNYLYVTDRLKELIKVKGFQVSPAEVEAIIRTHPKILDCAVIGVPDPHSGEAPKAFLVTQPGKVMLPDEIKEFVNSKVATFKRIKDVQFIEAIPKNPSGKILRRVLKEKYC